MTHTKILLLTLLLLPFSISAKPPVRWSPVTVSERVIIGTTESVEVSFTSSEPLSEVSVEVSGKSNTLVSVSPSHIDHVEPSVPQKILLIFMAPKGDVPRMVECTLHIKEGSKTLARPLPLVITTESPTAETIPPDIALPSTDRVVTAPALPTLEFVKDEIDVFFKTGTAPDTIKTLVESINGVFVGSVPEFNFYQIQVSTEGYENLQNLIQQLNQNESVETAVLSTFTLTLNFPNDPGTDLSYGPSQLNLPMAWDIETGKKAFVRGPRDSEEIRIAIIDNLFDSGHADLSPNVTSSTGNRGVTAPSGVRNHGTRVASIVGARGDNLKGIAGVMWNSSMHLYSTATQASPGSLYGPLVLSSVNDIIARGEPKRWTVNYSAGFECGNNNCTQAELTNLLQADSFWRQVIRGTRDRGADVLWVFAAGNNRVNIQNSSPARLVSSFSNVVTVAGVNSSGRSWRGLLGLGGTNYGEGVTVAAPADRVFSLTFGGGYDDGSFLTPASGTSFAAPYITGLSGLIRSLNPDLNAFVQQVILKYSSYDSGFRYEDGRPIFIADSLKALQVTQSAFQFPDEAWIVKIDYPASRFPDQFPSDLPLEQSGEVVQQNYAAAVTDGRFQQTRVFSTTRSLNGAINSYENYFASHGWNVQRFSFPEFLLEGVFAWKGNFDPSFQVTANENTITHNRHISVDFTTKAK